MKFRKRPIVIDAVQFTEPVGACAPDILELADFQCVIQKLDGRPVVLIETLDGTMRAEIGDYIIRGVKGECYPCKPDIFAASYEPVGEEVTP